MKQKQNKETDFCCPLCDTQLVAQPGDTMHPNDPVFGLTLFCPSLKCPAQEVSGHTIKGKEKDAYNVILAKFAGKRIETAELEEEPAE